MKIDHLNNKQIDQLINELKDQKIQNSINNIIEVLSKDSITRNAMLRIFNHEIPNHFMVLNHFTAEDEELLIKDLKHTSGLSWNQFFDYCKKVLIID